MTLFGTDFDAALVFDDHGLFQAVYSVEAVTAAADLVVRTPVAPEVDTIAFLINRDLAPVSV